MKTNIRIMPCLDMQNGRVVKGVHFVNIKDAGDPVACAKAYCAAGADELAMLDITATVENRGTMLEVVKRVAAVATIPFTVGGGIKDVASASAVIGAGANKVSTSSAAFRNPQAVIHAAVRPSQPTAMNTGQGDDLVRSSMANVICARISSSLDWTNALGSWARTRLAAGGAPLLEDAMPEFERTLIREALKAAQGGRQDAAKLLGWGRNTLTRKLKELGME